MRFLSSDSCPSHRIQGGLFDMRASFNKAPAKLFYQKKASLVVVYDKNKICQAWQEPVRRKTTEH